MRVKLYFFSVSLNFFHGFQLKRFFHVYVIFSFIPTQARSDKPVLSYWVPFLSFSFTFRIDEIVVTMFTASSHVEQTVCSAPNMQMFHVYVKPTLLCLTRFLPLEELEQKLSSYFTWIRYSIMLLKFHFVKNCFNLSENK